MQQVTSAQAGTVLGVIGPSGSGKTTLLEFLVAGLAAQGLRVNVIKHSHHDLELEPPRKDSAGFRQAGAADVMVASPFRYAIVHELRGAPEPIQRAIPPISVGGYIYSKNPADRLLLIDKVLRHEGEELAPGFVLEKLLPKAAIFNYKGYRYRVAY